MGTMKQCRGKGKNQVYEGVHKVGEDYYLVQTHTVMDLLLLHFIKMTIFMRTGNDAMIFLAVNNMS